jgi:GNAT superfamily N-acetyltransferase
MINAFHASHVEERQDAKMWLEATGDCAVALDALWSEGEHHRGHARAAMERLVALADTQGVMLSLVPRPLTQTGQGAARQPVDHAAPDSAALEAFYERLGFERSGGKFEGSPVLVRSPR